MCQAKGGHLVHVDTPKKLELITEMLLHKYIFTDVTDPLFIGFYHDPRRIFSSLASGRDL